MPNFFTSIFEPFFTFFKSSKVHTLKINNKSIDQLFKDEDEDYVEKEDVIFDALICELELEYDFYNGKCKIKVLRLLIRLSSYILNERENPEKCILLSEKCVEIINELSVPLIK